MIRLRTHTATLSCASCKRSTRTWELGPTYRWDQVLLIIMISQDIIITICSARHYDESSVLQPRTQTAIGGYHRLIQVYAIIWSYIHFHHDVSFAFEVISVYLSIIIGLFKEIHLIQQINFFASSVHWPGNCSLSCHWKQGHTQEGTFCIPRPGLIISSSQALLWQFCFVLIHFVTGNGVVKREKSESEVCGQQ